MALAWCYAHSKVKSNNLIRMCFCKDNIQKADTVFSDGDLEVMKSFDFLFYISLRDTVSCHVENIIIQQLSCVGSRSFLQNVLDRKRCLIVIDGLDEWIHPSSMNTFCPPGQKVPHRQAYKSCTFLTTSRPSKLDIIRLGTSEIDQQVEIYGIGTKEYEQLVTAVVKYLNYVYNTNRKPETFIKLLENNNLLDLSQIPIMVTQLICQWCEEVPLNMCKSIVYGKTLKMLFERSKTFRKQEKRLLAVETVKFPVVWKQLPLLQHLAQFAYSTLFTEDTNTLGMMFDHEYCEQNVYGLTSEDIELLCSVGIISRNKVTGTLSERKVKLQFLHRSFYEFMAAISIAMNSGEPYSLPLTVKNYFSKVPNFLELSNVLVFLASLCPGVFQLLNQLLLNTLHKDERFLEYRRLHFQGFMSYKTNVRYNRYRECNSNLKALQTLWTTCLREIERCGFKTTDVCLTDICIDDKIQMKIPEHKHLIQSSTSKLLSVSTCYYVTELSTVDSLVKLHMEGSCCEEFISVFSRFRCLQCLVLTNCKLHTQFSLEYFTELQSLHLFDVTLNYADLSGINTYLEKQTIMTQISLVEVKCAEHGLKDCNFDLDKKSDFELNISRHTKLVTLELRRVPIILTNVTIYQLESCNIETEVYIPQNLIRRLNGALKLEYLTIDLSNCDFDGYSSQTFGEALVETLPTLVFLKYLKIVNVDIGDNVLKLCPKMKALEQIKLWWVALTLTSLHRFIDTIPQTLGVINVELLACKMKPSGTSLSRRQLKEIEEEIRLNSGFRITNLSTQEGKLLTLEFRSVENQKFD